MLVCVALALYLWKCRNAVLLFEFVFLLFECVWYVWFMQWSSGNIFFVPQYRPSIVIHMMASTTEDALDIIRSIFLESLVRQVVSCTSDAYRFEVTIFGVLIAFTIGTLHIEQYPFHVWAVQILFCTAVYILHCVCLCYLGHISVIQRTERGNLVLYWYM
jgi:hypothetical protein